MSAYISRMIQRLTVDEPGVAGPILSPFVRSHSPIAEIDQRLGVDEQLGHGLDGVGPTTEGLVEPPIVPTTAPTRIQRKVAGPTPPPSQPNVAPAPAVDQPNPSTTLAPNTSPMSSPAAESADTPKVAPARPPLDPGPLFDIVPRYFDEVAAPEALIPAPAATPVPAAAVPAPAAGVPVQSKAVPGGTAGVPVQSKPSSTSTTEVRRLEASPRRESPFVGAPIPTRPSEGRVDVQPLQPASSIEHHWIWPQATTSMSAAPQLEPSPSPSFPEPTRTPSPAVQLYIVPRPRTPEPLIPAPVEFQQVEAPTPSPRRESAPAVRQTDRSAPSPVGQSPRRSPPGKLTIDSISVIGPLDRHFPNRRNLRLRYR